MLLWHTVNSVKQTYFKQNTSPLKLANKNVQRYTSTLVIDSMVIQGLSLFVYCILDAKIRMDGLKIPMLMQKWTKPYTRVILTIELLSKEFKNW